MKKIHHYALTLLFSGAAALQAESLSLITGEGGELSDTGWNWSDSAMWTPSVSEVAGNDLTIDAVTTTQILSTISDGFTAGDVNVMIKQNAPSASSGGSGHFTLNIDGNVTFDSLSWMTTSPGWWGSYIKIKSGSTLTVRNDLTVGNSGTNAYFINFSSNGDANYVGNLAVEGGLNINVTNGVTSHVFYTALDSFTVNGAVSMITQNAGDAGRWRIGNRNTSIGGLSGASSSNHQLYIDGDTTVTFTNKGDYSWNGLITDADSGAANSASFNIVMDASATGRQTMTLTGGYLNDITLNGGKFVLSSANATTGKLSLNGGFFGTADGKTAVNSAEWNSGGLLFDMAALENGYKITIAGEFKKAGSGQVEIDFGGLNGEDYIGYTFDLITAGSLNGFDTGDANADFAAKNLYGALAEFAWNDGTLTVTFGQIPEPAAFAALFGAAAMALALRRKRA